MGERLLAHLRHVNLNGALGFSAGREVEPDISV